MNTHDDDATSNKRQGDEPDLGPEPDWLIDDDEPVAAAGAEPVPAPEVKAPEPVTQTRPEARTGSEPLEGRAITISSTPAAVAVRRPRPWLWWAIPLLLLVVTAGVAWVGSTRGLNDLTTWSTLRFQHPGLLPARWSMLMWWVVLPLLAMFLIYGAMPAGRELTRMKRSGPLVATSLVAASVWIFAQHWRWEEVAFGAMLVSVAAMLLTILMIALSPHITKMWQRLFAVLPLSAALGFGIMLLTLSWQGMSSRPFGTRGTSILFLLLLVIIAAVFSFFMRDGVPGAVFTIWFLGVAQQQWGNDAVISLGAIVALIFTAALAAMGFILAVDSHRPSLTAQVSNRRGRVNFFRRSEKTASGELP